MTNSTAQADAFMGIFGFKRVETKTCEFCRCPFEPETPTQTVCDLACAAALEKREDNDRP